MAALRRYWMWPLTMLLGVMVLAIAPGGFVSNSRLIMHGLCAQTPSHTYAIGGHMLPFDARMTGIYGGAGVVLGYFAIRGRILSSDLPKRSILLVLTFLFTAMALDGFNSFLTDIGTWHPWETSNTTRLATGYGAGIAISVALTWLMGGTVFQVAERGAAVRGWIDLVTLGTGFVLMGLLIRFDMTWTYIPLSIFLMVAAWMVVSILCLVFMLLVSKRDEMVVARWQLHLPGTIASVFGLLAIAILAAGRRWLETSLGIPSNL